MEPPAVQPGNSAVLADRRRFLHRVLNTTIGLWVVSAATGVGYIAGNYAWPRKVSDQTGSERTASVPVADLEKAPVAKLLVQGQPVAVFKYKGDYRALSLTCTHLGCLVVWHPDLGEMLCPCHGSRYDANGNVLQGPAPAPLKHYDVRVAGNALIVG